MANTSMLLTALRPKTKAIFGGLTAFASLLFSSTSLANSPADTCQQFVQEFGDDRSLDVVLSSSLTDTSGNARILKFDKFEIPVIGEQPPRVSLERYRDQASVVLHADDVIQTVSLHSSSLGNEPNNLFAGLSGKQAFEVLIRSFSIRLSDLNCAHLNFESDTEKYRIALENMSLLVLKTVSLPYRTTAVYPMTETQTLIFQQPDSVEVRQFRDDEMIQSVYSPLNNIELALRAISSAYSDKTEITRDNAIAIALLEATKTKSWRPFENALKLMQTEKYPAEFQEPVIDHIDFLQVVHPNDD